MESSHVTKQEFLNINQWGKDVGNLKDSFYKLYPKVTRNGDCSPTDVLGNLQQTHVLETTTRREALAGLIQQADYYAHRKSKMFGFVDDHDINYKKYESQNRPSSWLGQRMRKFEVELNELIKTLKSPPVHH